MKLGVHKNSFYSWRIFRRFLFAVLFIGSTLTPTITAKATTQIDIPGPPGSGEFGKLVVWKNGRIDSTDISAYFLGNPRFCI